MSEAIAQDEAKDNASEYSFHPCGKRTYRGRGEELKPHVGELYSRKNNLCNRAQSERDHESGGKSQPCSHCRQTRNIFHNGLLMLIIDNFDPHMHCTPCISLYTNTL